MATEADYKALNERIRKAEQSRLILEAQEQVKKEKRDQLLKELKEAGINTEDLAGEEARLQREIDQDYTTALSQVSDFEKELSTIIQEEKS